MSPPGSFSVTVTPSSCPAPIDNYVDWTASSDASFYKIYYCTGRGCSPNTFLATRGAAITYYNHTDVSEGVVYRYRIVAENSVGSRQIIASATTPSCQPNLYLVPGTIGLNSGSLIEGSSVTFKATVRNNGTGNAIGTPTWNNNFRLDLNSPTFSATDVPIPPHATLTSLAPSASAVVVSGSWTASTGTHTLRVCADIPGNVVAESNETVTDNCEDWTFNVCNPTNPNAPSLVSPLDNAARLSSGTTLDWNPIASWGTSCAGTQRYTVYLEKDDPNPDIAAASYTEASNITAHPTGALDEGSRYYWRVRAHNGSLAAYSVPRSLRIRPNAPSGLAASGACDATNGKVDVSLTWTDNSTTETGYRIQRSDDGGTTWSNSGIPLQGPNVTSYTNENIPSGVNYQYRVRAEQTGLVPSLWSPVAATGLIQCPPGQPSTFTAVPECPAPGNADVQLTWTDVEGETSYRIQRATNRTFTAGLATFIRPADSTSYPNTNPALSTSYYYRIRAENSNGTSPWKNATPFPVTTTSCPSPNIAPVANAGPDHAVTVGIPHTQSGTVTDANSNLASYDWDFISCPGVCPSNPAPVSVSGGSAPAPLTYTPLNPGLYTLRLTVTDTGGLTHFDQATDTATAAPACGDGNLDAGEQCDDGNTISGDGCSATCQIELAILSADLTPTPQVADLSRATSPPSATVTLNAILLGDTDPLPHLPNEYTFTFDCDGTGPMGSENRQGVLDGGGNISASIACAYITPGIYSAQVTISRPSAVSGGDTETVIIKPPLPSFKEVFIYPILQKFASLLWLF